MLGRLHLCHCCFITRPELNKPRLELSTRAQGLLFFAAAGCRLTERLDPVEMSDSHSDSDGELGMFAEPEGYYQPEKEPTFAKHEMQDGRELSLRMVGHNPLWVRKITTTSACGQRHCAIKVSISLWV